MKFFHLILTVLLLSACPDDPGPEPKPGPIDSSEVGWLLHVNGRSATDIYVVGGEPNGGRMLHFDGESWDDVDLPADVHLLNWIHLFDEGAVAVGDGGVVLRQEGDTWIQEETPTDQDLWGVWGSASGDVWAVGGNGRSAGQATILRRQDGVWGVVEAPELERPGVNAWFKVWGSASDDVYVVGQNGGMLRWNGVEFTETGVGTSRDLIAIHGVSSDAIMVVGGRANGVVSYWDGASWTTQELSPAPGINGVWMTGEKTAWIAGARGLLREATVSEGMIDVPLTKPSSEFDLHAVTQFDDLGVIAVGGNFGLPQGPYEGAFVLKEEP